MLKCSPWWVKQQARQRRIPYCWIGGSYRFTPEHVAEIARLFEVRPLDGRPTTRTAKPRTARTLSVADDTDVPPVLLRSRPPRRVRKAASRPAAA
jgi:hypothetical protein